MNIHFSEVFRTSISDPRSLMVHLEGTDKSTDRSWIHEFLRITISDSNPDHPKGLHPQIQGSLPILILRFTNNKYCGSTAVNR